MKNKIVPILTAILCLAGFGIMIYPAVSDFINRINSSRAIQEFATQMEDIEDTELMAQLEYARQYNDVIAKGKLPENGEAVKDYYEILDFTNHMMGYVEIDKINVKLPIYHGVSSDVLAKGVGHLPNSTFPIGGEGYHAVLTAHTGLPSAKLFTDLVELKIGDCFKVFVADRELTYKVDNIETVIPSEVDDITPVPGEDYCTLVTCTPYGINSHRLLVRGARVYEEENIDTNTSTDNTIKFIGYPSIDLIVLILCLISTIKRLILEKKSKKEKACPEIDSLE